MQLLGSYSVERVSPAAASSEVLATASGSLRATEAVAAAPLSVSLVAAPPDTPVLPARTAPVNAVFLAAKGVDAPDLLRTLASLSESVPDALVVLIVSQAEASAVLPRVVARSGSPAGGQLALNLLMYSWAALDALQPSSIRRLPAPLERYSLYAWILDDLRRCVRACGCRLGAT